MVQKGTVVKITGHERAVVLVPRASACTGSCDACGGCASLLKSMETTTLNTVGARVGDIVNLESESKTIYAMMFLVFICPVIGVVLFYLLASRFTQSEAYRAIFAFFGLIFGGIGAFIYNRVIKNRERPVVVITSVEKKAETS
jgi:positive regulator of sigma E activity